MEPVIIYEEYPTIITKITADTFKDYNEVVGIAAFSVPFINKDMTKITIKKRVSSLKISWYNSLGQWFHSGVLYQTFSAFY
jgi:hypothetical protein